MKIDPTTTRLLGNIAGNAKAGNAPTAQATQSGTNTVVSRSNRVSASGPGDFNDAKVARLSSALDAGTFKVNPEAIADGVLADARAFLSSRVSGSRKSL